MLIFAEVNLFRCKKLTKQRPKVTLNQACTTVYFNLTSFFLLVKCEFFPVIQFCVKTHGFGRDVNLFCGKKDEKYLSSQIFQFLHDFPLLLGFEHTLSLFFDFFW